MAQTDAKSGSTKKMVFLAVLLVAVAVALAGYLVTGRHAPKKIVTTGDRAPDFTLPATDGRNRGLADVRGKVALVHFWATWCPPCVEEFPTLAKLNDELKGNDFELLAVSVDEGGAAAVNSFLKKNGLAMPVLLDPDASVAKGYGTYKFPETYILDRRGIIRYKAVGPRDWRDPQALELLKGLIAEK